MIYSFSNNTEINFTTQVTNTLDSYYNNWIKLNINKIKSKDKKVLKELQDNIIFKQSIIKTISNGLDILWSNEFNKSYNQFSALEDSISEFKLIPEVIRSATKLSKQLKKTDIGVARKIRSRDISEKLRTARILKTTNITDQYNLFANEYITRRNKEVARNFTDTYTNKIFQSVSTYLNSNLNITREKNLIHHLSFRQIQQLTPEERRLYTEELSNYDLKSIYGLNSPETYDNLKFSPKQRIQRIALTEINAAYNLGRFAALVDEGFTEFIWKTNSRTKQCVLCESLNGTLIRLEDLVNIGYTDFRGVNTRRDKSFPGNEKILFSPAHPSCDCFIIGNPKQTKEDRAGGALVTATTQQLLQQVYGTIGAVSGATSAYNTSRGLYNRLTRYSQQQVAKEEEKQKNNKLALLLTTAGVLSIPALYLLWLTQKDTILDKIDDFIIDKTVDVITNVGNNLQQLAEDKLFQQDSIYNTGIKVDPTNTVSEYLNNNNILNISLVQSINNLVNKSQLTKLITNLNDISELTNLARNSNELALYNELQQQLQLLVSSNNIKTKDGLFDLIFPQTKVIKPLKIPVNIQQKEKVLIQNTIAKQQQLDVKLKVYENNTLEFRKQLLTNKDVRNRYLQDIDYLRELDSKLSEELIGVNYLNKEYQMLLDTTTDDNLKKYLSNKIDLNNQTKESLLTNLNSISDDLYNKKINSISPNDIKLKDELVSRINDKSSSYIDYRNNSTNTLKSLQKKLSNINDSNDSLDIKLTKIDDLENTLKTLEKDSLLYDSLLYDVSLLKKIDNSVNIKDLNYLFRSYDVSKEIVKVDTFRTEKLFTFKDKLRLVKEELIRTKYQNE